MDFDPEQHITKLVRRQKTADGQWRSIELDYMEVKWRLVWLRADHADAHVQTELATLDLERSLAVFKATVSVPEKGSATGWGSETADDWRDFIEKAETKALGRALSALGFGTQFCEDHQFSNPSSDPEARVVDSPVDRRPQQTRAGGVASPAGTAKPASKSPQSGASTDGAPGWTDRPCTEPQIKAMYAIARGAADMDDGTFETWCRARYGAKPSELNRRQASECIDALKLGAAS